jgi:hypothetical protein
MSTRRERWAVSVDAGDVATLQVPADLQRERTFEIDCRLVVRPREGARSPWHAMRVSVNGALEWSRRIGTNTGGGNDSLDLHFRRSLERGQALQIVATTEVHDALRVSLAIEAEEG